MQRSLPFYLVLFCAASVFALTMGARQTMGLFLSPLNTATGLGIVSISLAFAFGQLWWGLTQPFAGALADRFGAAWVLSGGIFMVALGTFLTPFMDSTLGLIFSIGVLGAGGAGIAGPAVLMATVTRMIPTEKRSLASGIVNAGGSFGQFLMAPVAGALIASMGWAYALHIIGLLVLFALPAALSLRKPAPSAPVEAVAVMPTPRLPILVAIQQAVRTPSYCLLCAGFFVCGFHIAFLTTHLPGVIALCGLPETYSAWSLAMIGLFNIVGSVGIGWAMNRWRMKSLLALIYALRGLAVLGFMFAPKNGIVVLIFAAFMGLSFLSTVPPTAGLVARFFGPSNMAMLFGIVLVIHQIGGFLGAWLGGRVFAATGNYDWMWYADILLAVAAALLHLPIREANIAKTPNTAVEKSA